MASRSRLSCPTATTKAPTCSQSNIKLPASSRVDQKPFVVEAHFQHARPAHNSPETAYCPPKQQDFILFSSTESVCSNTQFASSSLIQRPDKSLLGWDNNTIGCRRPALERYLQSEEDFEKVPLGLKTRRAAEHALDLKLLDILDYI